MFNQVLNFVVENYRLICDAIAIVVLVILFFAKKRPVKDINSVIFNACLKAIEGAEHTVYKGKNKLAYAVSLVKEDLLKIFPDLDVNRYVSFIENIIENILSMPKKK